jgi:succinate dehydrogenase / fumarate reductase cytochrome b subunit
MSAVSPAQNRSLLMSNISLKIIMAVSGFLLVGFVLAHMLGNLQIFFGQRAYNHYAHQLQSLGELLWIMRIGLLVALATHVWSAVTLTKRNREARPTRYENQQPRVATVYARTMVLTGVTILLYVVYHLLHFTTGTVHSQYAGSDFDLDGVGVPDVYTYFVRSFQNPLITIVYIAANLMVAMHLAHAVSSMFRTLGLSVGRFRKGFSKAGPAVGLAIAVGNVVMPLACLLGIIKA